MPTDKQIEALTDLRDNVASAVRQEIVDAAFRDRKNKDASFSLFSVETQRDLAAMPGTLDAPVEGSSLTPAVLDACCGSRMFWFDREDDRAVFGDIRREEHSLTDSSSRGGARRLIIDPDQLMDFRAMPFSDEQFHLVVFDPPHLIKNGKTGWLAKKYGKLGDDWRKDIRAGFSECFRVLKPHGTLIFKWNEHEVKVSEILSLTDQKPLFGNKCGKTAKTHWIVFMKTDAALYIAPAGRQALQEQRNE